jgi:Protein of unknown function (DUF4241)
MTPDGLFDAGARHEWPEGGRSVLTVSDVCTLACPTGRIAVCGLESAFEGLGTVADYEILTVPPGEYSLTLSVANFPPRDDFPAGFQRVAAAALGIRSSDVTSWTKSARSLDIDAGTGCIFDLASTAQLVALREQRNGDLTVIRETLTDRFATRPRDVTPAQVAFFECGMGDGTYDLWIGRDESGDALALIADLELLDHAQRL